LNSIKFRRGTALLLAFLFLLCCGCTTESPTPSPTVTVTATADVPPVTDYSLEENWSYLELDTTQKDADVFFICPTVYGGADNLSLSDTETMESFLGAINMEKGIYDDNARFFAPKYQQVGLEVYTLEEAEQDPYFDIAYGDVEAAFTYYMEHYNDGRPVILAGFSQGADLAIRLVKNCFDTQERQAQLVACYAIGWRLTQEEVDTYPQLQAAQGETDTGVVIAFNSEDPQVTDSLMIPQGTKTLAINPLNWKTDGTVAEKEENLGACFTDYTGEILQEIPQLTGAYLDDTRGALKVTDVSPETYPPGLDLFDEGVYHLYDYQFFYRNLEQNVQDRIAAFLDGAA
jgi:hypothetical protein